MLNEFMMRRFQPPPSAQPFGPFDLGTALGFAMASSQQPPPLPGPPPPTPPPVAETLDDEQKRAGQTFNVGGSPTGSSNNELARTLLSTGGAAVGTAIMPGIGTVLGGGIGKIL